MQRSSKLYKYVRKPILDAAGKEQKASRDHRKWLYKEVLLNPNMYRLVVLLIGGTFAANYYSTNGGELNKKSPKKNEPMGDIKVERYNDRLSKYAASLELATSYSGTDTQNREMISAANKSYRLQDKLGMNFNDITQEQLLLIQVAEKKRADALKRIYLDKDLMHINSRRKVFSSIEKREKTELGKGVEEGEIKSVEAVKPAAGEYLKVVNVVKDVVWWM